MAAVNESYRITEDDEDNSNYTTSFTNGRRPVGNDEGASTSSASSDEIPAPYAGMPKEVLLHYSRQRRFVIARYIIAATGVTLTLLILSLVIAFVAISPGCQKFYQTSPIYQVYPKSFQDSDSDGVGDIKGIINRLPHFEDLGVKTLWLNPVYPSPQVDNGYDISNYVDIEPTFGSLEDIKALIQAMHDRGMYLVMDFVPNHSSDQHPWFVASSNRSHEDHEKYKDYYVWVDGVEGTPPNNWQSIFSFDEPSAWTWHPVRQQYYYHQFYSEQPDLNLRHPAVQEELKDILRFWLELGVDGFRCDAVKHMFEAKHLHNNTVVDNSLPLTYDNVYPDFNENQAGIHDVVADWRDLLREYSTEPGVYRFMETEVYDSDLEVITRYYGTDLVKEADFSMNFQFIELTAPWTTVNVQDTVKAWMDKMDGKYWPNWTVGNHDNPRSVTRLGSELQARLAAMLTLTLPGTPGIYYGEEIGMEDSTTFTDVDTRNYARTPMQWNATLDNAGFSNTTVGSTWLPVNGDYATVNVESQTNDTASVMGLYKSLIDLRSNEDTFLRGWLCLKTNSLTAVSYVREMPGGRSFLILLNFSDERVVPLMLPQGGTVDFIVSHWEAKVVAHTSASADRLGKYLLVGELTLEPYEGMVLEYDANSSSDQLHINKQNQDYYSCYTSQAVCKNSIGLLQKC